MKKVIIIVISVLVVGGLGVGAFFFFNKTPGNNSSSNPLSLISGDSEVNFTEIDACDILTEDIAKEVIGNNIISTSTGSNKVATNDIVVSSCNYTTSVTTDNGSETPKVSGANLLIRIAKTSVGAESNKSEFITKDADVENVEGIGDDAFYNPSFRQLHVLKGNNWYIITAFKDAITNGSLDSNRKLAEKLNFQ